MHPVSTEFKRLIKEPTRSFGAKIKIRNNEYDDEYIEEITLEETVNPDESFQLGSVASSKLEMTVLNISDVTFENARVEAHIGLEINDVIEYVPLGVFTVDSVDMNKGRTKLVCFDDMIKFEKPYFSELSYPATLRSVAQEICTKAGVTLATTIPTTRVSKIEGYTLREAIGFVASFLGGFARFNRNGELEVIAYQTTDEEITADNYIDLQTSERVFSIGKLTCKIADEEDGEKRITTGSGSNEIYFENPIMTQAQLNSIYSALSVLNYMPYTMNWQGNPALQAGDKVQITDLNGQIYSTLLMEQQIKYTGGLSATATAKGKTETAQEFQSSGSLTQKVERYSIEQALIKEAFIEDLKVVNARFDNLTVDFATIDNLKAVDARIDNLTVDFATVKDLTAVDARITNLKVSTAMIDNLAVTSAKIADASILSAKIMDAAINSAKIEDAAITSAKIGNAQITTAKIATGAITTALIETGAIETAQIADGSITDAKIVDLTANKITAGTIDAGVINVVNLNAANLTVGKINGQQIANGAISEDLLADLAVTTDKLNAGAVSSDKVANNAITTAKILDSAINAAKIAAGSVTEFKISNGAITNPKLADLAVDAEKLANNAVTSNKILSNAITDAKIAAGAVTELKLGNGAVTTGKLANLAVEASKLADSSVTATKIANLAVGTAAIANAAITDAKILNLDAAKITTGRLDAARVQIGSGTQFADGYDPTKIEIGARNYARELGGDNYNIERVYSQDRSKTNVETINGKKWLRYTGEVHFRISAIPVESDTEYTWSFLAYSSILSTGANLRFYSLGGYNSKLVDITTTPKKFFVSGKTKIDAVQDIFHISLLNPDIVYYFADFQLEKGNVPSDYSSAPEDSPALLWQYADTTFIDGGKIYANTITANEIAGGTITAASGIIANLAVGTAAIQDAAITNAKIQNIDAAKITTGRLDAARIQIGSGTQFAEGYDPTKIELGGSNLTILSRLASHTPYNTAPVIKGDTITTTMTSDRTGMVNFAIQVSGYMPENRQYTLSGYMKVNGKPLTNKIFNIKKANTYNPGLAGDKFFVDDSTGYFEITETYRGDTQWLFHANTHLVKNDIVLIERLMFEKGNKASDWSPASEDNPALLWLYADTTYIDGGKIYANTVTANEIAGGTITANELAANSVVAGKIATNAVTAVTISANAITAAKIAANAITTDKIFTGAVTADKIVANAVTADKIAASAVTANKMAANSITAANGAIANAAITSAKIADAAITNAKIANASITSAKIASIDAGKITTGTLSAIDITGVNITGSTIQTSLSDYGELKLWGGRLESIYKPYGHITESASVGSGGFNARIVDTNFNTTSYTSIKGGRIDTDQVNAKRARADVVEAKSIEAHGTQSKLQIQVSTSLEVKNMSGDRFMWLKAGDIQSETGIFRGEGGGSGTTLRLRIASDSTSSFMQSIDTYNRTYSYAANMYVTGSGVLGRTTSASKYKLYVKNLRETKGDSYANRILDLTPKSWYDKSATEAYAKYLTKHNGSYHGLSKTDEDIPHLKRHYGLIAEDVRDVGLSEYVSYGENDEIEGIEYDRLWTLLIPVVRDLKKNTEDEINWLKMENQLLKGRIQKLEGVA